MDHIKMVVDNVWVENKDPLVIGVAMVNEDGHHALIFSCHRRSRL